MLQREKNPKKDEAEMYMITFVREGDSNTDYAMDVVRLLRTARKLNVIVETINTEQFTTNRLTESNRPLVLRLRGDEASFRHIMRTCGCSMYCDDTLNDLLENLRD